MYRFNFFITVSTITFLMSCNIKTKRNACIEGNWQQTPNYIIKEDLSSKDYSEVEGYFPKEGLVPTAEIAFQIAEPILKQIYGSKKIENEKPFSINIEDDVWVIEGHLDKELLGGVAYMEIRKSNGEILKVIHTK
jgi:hypothetical protein